MRIAPRVRPEPGSRRRIAAAVALLVAAACAPGPTPSGPATTSFGAPSPASAVPSPTFDLGSNAPSSPPASLAPSPTASAVVLPTCPPETDRFPPGYTAFHTYASLCTTLVAEAAAHPDVARLLSIGRSAEGREIWAMEIGAHLTDGTDPPVALFDGLHHALEHLSLEMTVAISRWLLDGYGSDPRITDLLRSRTVAIVFGVNPDGAAYDIAGGAFHEWRKNRQPGPGGAVGTDLNRNYDDHWGCCGLVSATASSPYFRGTAPFSAPETVAVRDFVRSFVTGGRQRIRAAITFHTSGRLVMWPFGFTTTPVVAPMTAADHQVFVAMGTEMARLDGYRAEQASGLYVDSGTARDWYYGEQGIFAFTFELGSGTYQPSSAIAPEVDRNRDAVMYLISMADCPYRAIGEAGRCG